MQKLIHNDELLQHVNELGEYMRKTLTDELGSHPFFRDLRGRGLRFSLEYQCENQHEFGNQLQKVMLEKHNILI